MDYDSTPITATFTAGSTITIINVPVIRDSIVEGLEHFVLNFTIPSSLESQVIPGTIAETFIVIRDNTSKQISVRFNKFKFEFIISYYCEIQPVYISCQ